MDNELQISLPPWLRALSLRTKLILGFALLSAIVSFLTARGFFTNNLQNQGLEEFRSRVSSVTQLTSLQQNGDEFASISSAQDPLYEKFRAQNLAVRSSDPEIEHILALRKSAQGIYHVVSVGDDSNPNIAAYGEQYLGATSTLNDNFDTMSSAIAEPEIQINAEGASLTAYAPILNQTGEHVGAIEIKFRADTIVRQQRQTLVQAIFIFIIAVAIGSGFGFVAGNVFTDPIIKLTNAASDFATGKPVQPLDIATSDEIGELAKTFTGMADEISSLITDLETRVADRTQDLENRSQELEFANKRIQRRAAQFEALAQVTQNITSVRDLQELLPRVTAVISDNFNFYHVGIFLLDSFSEYAVLVAANSEGGQRMLARQHRLRVGEEGIVGYAAFNGKPRLALDVGQDKVFFNNPDLPETHSEVALPLISKNIIVGVLDVQSTEIAAFSNEDIQMLSLLADQVSLAIENARLFDDTRRALAESEMASRRATHEAWERLPEQQQLVGFRYDITGAAPLKQPLSLNGSGSSGDKVAETEAGQTVVPIELRGESIGNLIVQSSSGNQWDEDQLDLIRAVAERIALSAENARLFEETTARADRERLVSEITSKIRSHNDPQTMIQTAVEELRAALGASRVEILPQSVKGAEKSEA